MKSKSCYSLNMDPYKAGVEIGHSLKEINPEVVFIFPTIHYKGSNELPEAIYDVLGNDKLVLIGNTGEGFYEKEKVAGAGVSALAINSSGAIQWKVSMARNVGAAPYAATLNCIEKLKADSNGKDPKLFYLTSDFRTDAAKIINSLKENTSAPVIGGLAGDDYNFADSFIYVNREVHRDSLAMLGMYGEFSFEIMVAHNMEPIGNVGKISEIEGLSVKKIDGIPAMNYIEKQIGKPLETVDDGIITFRIFSEENPEEYRIRSIFLPENREVDKSVNLFAKVEENTSAQVCLAPPEKIIQSVKNLSDSITKMKFDPDAALIVSCAGRKNILFDRINLEVEELLKSTKSLSSLSGYPSYGEFGPLKINDHYSVPMFHNMTFILLLLGDK